MFHRVQYSYCIRFGAFELEKTTLVMTNLILFVIFIALI